MSNKLLFFIWALLSSGWIPDAAGQRNENPDCACGRFRLDTNEVSDFFSASNKCMATVITSNLVVGAYSCYMKLQGNGKSKREAVPYLPSFATRLQDSDLVLIGLDNNDFTSSPDLLRPACIPTAPVDWVGQEGHYYYYGNGTGRTLPDVFRGVIMSARQCTKEMDYQRVKDIRDSDLCLRIPDVSPALSHGGPLFVKDKNDRVFLAGVATYFKNLRSPTGIEYVFFSNIAQEWLSTIDRVAEERKSSWCHSLGLDLMPAMPAPHRPPWPWTQLTTSADRDESADCECGIKNPEKPSKQTGRIIGGEPVTPFEFPWIVQLHMPLFDDTATSGGCGGALINDRMILTAAGCVLRMRDEDPERYTWKLASETVTNGTIFLHSHRRYAPGIDMSMAIESQMRVAFPHPDYFESKQTDHKSQTNNIAIIFLEKPVDFSWTSSTGTKLRPICLPKIGERIEPLEGRMATAAGWGQTDYGKEKKGVAKVLQKVTLPITSMDVCTKYQKYLVYNLTTHNHFCAGNPEVKTSASAFRGDTGGPFIIDENGKWFQVGLFSYGAHAAIRKSEDSKDKEMVHLQFFTDVQKLLPFIDYHAKRIGAKWCKS